MSENTLKECIGAAAVQCPRLPETRGATPEALVQLYRDGSTRVFCIQIEEKGGCKKNDGLPCDLQTPAPSVSQTTENPTVPAEDVLPAVAEILDSIKTNIDPKTMEAFLILKILEKTAYDPLCASAILKISPEELLDKMKRHGIFLEPKKKRGGRKK